MATMKSITMWTVKVDLAMRGRLTQMTNGSSHKSDSYCVSGFREKSTVLSRSKVLYLNRIGIKVISLDSTLTFP